MKKIARQSVIFCSSGSRFPKEVGWREFSKKFWNVVDNFELRNVSGIFYILYFVLILVIQVQSYVVVKEKSVSVILLAGGKGKRMGVLQLLLFVLLYSSFFYYSPFRRISKR